VACATGLRFSAREHGKITQKIGTSSIEIDHEGKKARITFIDTPGHAAFAKMRGRGANAADIGLLIVAANDGVMPQTKESISLLKVAAIPFIVVITKADLPTKNIDKVKQPLALKSLCPVPLTTRLSLLPKLLPPSPGLFLFLFYLSTSFSLVKRFPSLS
jgi:translation initiation factor IF-2